MLKLRRACQIAKQALSTAKDTMLGVEALMNGVDFNYRLNVARYEAECGDAMAAALNVTRCLCLSRINHDCTVSSTR